MATHRVPKANWYKALADLVKHVDDGDTIECLNHVQVARGLRALARCCPEKTVVFTVQDGDATVSTVASPS